MSPYHGYGHTGMAVTSPHVEQSRMSLFAGAVEGHVISRYPSKNLRLLEMIRRGRAMIERGAAAYAETGVQAVLATVSQKRFRRCHRR